MHEIRVNFIDNFMFINFLIRKINARKSAFKFKSFLNQQMVMYNLLMFFSLKCSSFFFLYFFKKKKITNSKNSRPKLCKLNYKSLFSLINGIAWGRYRVIFLLEIVNITQVLMKKFKCFINLENSRDGNFLWKKGEKKRMLA